MLLFLSNSLHSLRILPYKIRLGVLCLSYLACLLAFVFISFFSLDASIFALTIALAAWLLQRRGAFACTGLVILTIAVFNILHTHASAWSNNLLISFMVGSLVFIVEALFIIYLREMLDATEKAKRTSQEAERLITQANEQQKRLNREKDQLLLNVSHEMRTPLTELHGYLELLQTYQTELDVETHAKFLTNAIGGCEELETLVNNVLDAMHAGNITPRLEKIVISELIGDVVNQFDPRKIQAFTVNIHTPTELQAMADQQYVRRIIRNLLSNAFKYAPPQTIVNIRAAVYEAENACTYICVRIEDKGPGIPLEEQSRLFGKFARLERDLYSATRGTGLGLFICKQLVEVMGGSIWVESSGIAGEGSCFCFTLPYVPQHHSLLFKSPALSR